MLFVVSLLVPAAAQAQGRTVTGRVVDESGAPLSGVAVQMKGNASVGVSTSSDGRYSLSLPPRARALTFSYVGMDPKEVILRSGQDVYDITLGGAIELEAVTINAGIITREAATFTGSVTQVTQAQLKQSGMLNPLVALSTLDPSLNLVVDNLAGSNPNALPNIEINGKTSLDVSSITDQYSVNPNLPHFVIDGFDSTLEKVNDLDISRIASMTVLKDAGSTAIYGAKGANGVIVVATIRPKAGELMVNYSGNATVSFADLSDYNLMNAEEKLRFEALSGYYDIGDPGDIYYKAYDHPLNTSNYQQKAELVGRGIDTYWLKYPVRTGLSHQHFLSVSGGDGKLYYQAQMGYNNKVGVMKGSNHENVNGGVFLQYRIDNKFNVSNDMNFGSTNSHTGSYGSFESWAKMSPYYKPYNDDGNLVANANPITDVSNDGIYVANPLYNAMLDTDNIGQNVEFVNNTRFEYTLLDLGLRFTGGLSLKRSSASNENYKDPRHTDFRTDDFMKKGSYTYGNSNLWSWSGNLSASITRTFADMHNFNLLVRAQADNTKGWGSSYSVEGLPEGAKPNPSQAEYPLNSHPTYGTSVIRGVSFIGTLAYNYDTRYLLDLTINRDGSTSFGKDNPFTTNWSVGAGWNISREKFAQNWTWADNVKLRGSYGTNANQANNMISSTIYNYDLGRDYFGQAWTLAQIANPMLDWQKTSKLSVGLDVSMLDSRLNLTFDIHRNLTDPLVITLPQPPSSGADPRGYDINMGHIDSRGWTASASYIFVRRPEDRMLFSARISAANSKQKYGGFGDAYAMLNEQFANSLSDIKYTDDHGNVDQGAVDKMYDILKNNTALRRYYDGGDPDGLWAVKSLGIDPATGMEIFRDLNGNPVFVYDPQNVVQIATSRAKVHGTFGFTFNYKNFRSNVTFRYSLGGYAFNRDLYAKVENIINYAILDNQDKRALYDRWQNPGDISEFKSIRSYASSNPISSRFINKNNYLEATAIQLSYDCSEMAFAQRLNMRSLMFTVSMNDLFRLSTIKQERGLDYPFARNITFSISTSF